MKEIRSIKMYNAQVCLERICIMQKKKGFRYVSTMLRDADIPVSTIDNIKQGKRPSIDRLMELADYFDCSIDYLVGRTDSPDMNRK